VTRARTVDGYVDDEATIAEVAVELFRAYAPPRPVRLLGVRIAGFEDEAPAAKAAPVAPPPPGQLVLPLPLVP
jgi:DNA polymerase-4